jgi:hypothetical protein
MSYGIQVKNDTGDFVLDSAGVMYLVDQGTCKFSPSVSSPRSSIPYANGIMINKNGLNEALVPYFYQSGYTTWPSTYSQCIANNFVTYQQQLSASLPHVANMTQPDFPLSGTAIAFVQIPPQGIIQMGHVTNILPEFNSGATFVVQSVNTSLVNYKVFDKTLPAVSGTYGMKVFNSAGETVFDSRPEILGVQDFFNVTAAQFQNVITQNAVIYLTLKKPTPNAYISSPTWANFTAVSNYSPNSRGFAKISQINDTTLSISMQRYGRALNDYRYNRSYFADCQILVARST